ncbi:carboxylesterase family protein [Pseudonocardiaceae bacterium YIM PH 21723]|nr:carboxylesterase family protein [Pseudonocardiaceae bacterium YIM PH 21723]
MRSLIASALVALVLLTVPPATPDRAVVRTADGPVRGTVTAHSRTFQGIPYAAPPVGENRWRAPRPAHSWVSTKDATKPGEVCLQRGLFLPGTPDFGSEDCLFLNVTTPAKPGRYPVLVWIHGGGFVYGSGDYYDARQLAERGDVVVVTVNYRLGTLGYLGLPGLSGGGVFGLQDQQAALRWVRRNAAAFGGDPANVTLSGESAGALSACAHLTSPTALGLFHKVIIQSGPCTLRWQPGALLPSLPAGSLWIPRAEADRAGAERAAALGCPDADLACLRRLPASALLTNDLGVAPAYGGPLLPDEPAAAVRAGHTPRLPVLIGSNRDEHRAYLYEEITERSYPELIRAGYGEQADRVLAKYPAHGSPALAWAAVGTDAIWTCPTHRITGELARRMPVYAYEFRDRTAPILPPEIPVAGAYHAAELAYLFPHPAYPLNSAQLALGERMQRYWAEFAHTGSTGWPTAPTVQGLDIPPTGIGPVDLAGEHHCDFWSEILGTEAHGGAGPAGVDRDRPH